MAMTIRRQRIDLAAACALGAALISGCSPEPAAEPSSPAISWADSRSVRPPLNPAEPGRLAEDVISTGFRSRSATESPDAPEISLGDPVDAPAFNPSLSNAAPSKSPLQNTASPNRAGLQRMAVRSEAPAFDSSGKMAKRPAAARVPQANAAAVAPWTVAPDFVPERLPQVSELRQLPEMGVVARQADELIRQGFRLAERGAVYSARQNFLEALARVARALDQVDATAAHSQALSAGRTALFEARDFVDADPARPVNLGRAVAVHRTPVLKAAGVEGLSPVVAEQRYYAYAQEQLIRAVQGVSSGSLALYALGKSAPGEWEENQFNRLEIQAEQVTCYQAALMVDPANFRAANELGVILAENGRVDSARNLFESSLRVSEQPAIWHNLAVAHERLGNRDLAIKAERRAQQLQAVRPNNVTGDNIRWVDPQTFAANVSPSEGLLAPAGAGSQQGSAAQSPAATKKRTAQRPFWDATR